MAAAATKTVLTALLAFSTGCSADRAVTTLSERHLVCAHLPRSVIYQNEPPGPDFDLGSMKIEEKTVGVFIGRHPRFSHRVMKKGVEAKDGFKLLGKERSDDLDKLLFAYERGNKEGPIYVMYTASDLSGVEQLLPKRTFLINCR